MQRCAFGKAIGRKIRAQFNDAGASYRVPPSDSGARGCDLGRLGSHEGRPPPTTTPGAKNRGAFPGSGDCPPKRETNKAERRVVYLRPSSQRERVARQLSPNFPKIFLRM